MMKAWAVSDYDAEVGVIVFAETDGKAKSLAKGHEGFEYSDWTDLSVRRVEKLDGKKESECVADWTADARMYYESGFFPEDGAPMCDWCGLYEYDEFPESRVTDWGDADDEARVCAACVEHERAKEEANAAGQGREAYPAPACSEA
jgi:hypothetical protein